ncbi:MAG: 5-formyltetrahydrofolate cyclo-ligase [Planctomycetaceae bacterium]|nr:5-formyltetrahydrofolate cyclo-ligase [Planctomycetaceae bacterium]
MTKNELRLLVKVHLGALTDFPQRSILVQRNLRQYLTAFLKPSAGLMTYISFGSEVVTKNIEDFFPSLCRFLAVPMIQNGEIVPVRIESGDELEAGTFGILEPKPPVYRDRSRQIALDDIDVVLVPGLAFDRSGSRLGRGKGYYDRFLKKLKPSALKIGLAFECQIFDEIPADGSDVPLDLVITERGRVDESRAALP